MGLTRQSADLPREVLVARFSADREAASSRWPCSETNRGTVLIQIHEFNSEWWGGPVGIVVDAEFFFLTAQEQAKLLEPYQWAEYRAAAGRHPSPETVRRAGFFHADTQIGFRISLNRVPATPDLDSMTARFADQAPFAVKATEMMTFSAERFIHLPNASAMRVNSRYALWSDRLVANDPEWCMEVLDSEEAQGWFLGTGRGKGLNLTLAMLRRDARIPGLRLYRKALVEYARRGATMGWASYSASNICVLNIWASLGALATSVEHFWLWTGGCDQSSDRRE